MDQSEDTDTVRTIRYAETVREGRLGGGKGPSVARRSPRECVCFRGLCWTEDGLFGKGQGQRVRFGRCGKGPQPFFQGAIPFFQTGLTFPQTPGLTNKRTQKKTNRARYARASKERDDAENPLRHEKRQHGGKRGLGRKKFNRKGSRDSPSQLPEILVGMTRFELATP